MAHAVTCDFGRGESVYCSGADDRKPHGQRLCKYRQDLTAPLPALCLMEVIMADLNSVFAEAAARHAKYPRYVWTMPDLPKGPTGKILRHEVSPPQDLRQG